ncbi:Type I restriction-modification system, specificity subunit S [Methanosarcina sp. Kolksee]|uniref:restriction endonuclease subunit S n=1 Tax=Methanosarcina sp. Kolksee TaxID=1434099 RepID=UPI000615B368|nr:restriction endonuclease subunit S [Methanosarcina sp. Kolksee]AKB49193.1 Type I restriction-modification system, specificity subunit S [Methanosarcina sp. Kolksee]
MSALVGGVNESIEVKNGQEKYDVKLGIREWKRYPEYKNSGVEWIGEIPKEWEVKPLKFASELNPEALPENTDPDYILKYIDIGNVSLGTLVSEPTEMKFCNSPSRARKIVKNGDIIISTVRTYLKAILLITNPDPNLIVSTGFAVIRSSLFNNPKYLYYAVRSTNFIEAVMAHSEGIGYPAINTSVLGKLPILITSSIEQQAIVNFLDRETSKINTLIEKKQRLIELLEEKRSALISHAVTKGLDPDVKMKDSEVEWIGEIPENWNAIKIKRLCQVKRGASPRPIDNPIYFDDDGEYSWVRISDVTASNKYLRVTEQKLSLLGQSKSICLEPGSLFLSIAGSVGKPIITKIKCCIHDGFVYFEGSKQNSEYLFYLFSCSEMYKGLGKLGTQLNLNTDTIGDIRVPVPFPKEQEEIANFLDCETEKIDTFINKISAQIEKLKEYRTALISAAVTGKIDVREEVA